jgi:hypothetical protein
MSIDHKDKGSRIQGSVCLPTVSTNAYSLKTNGWHIPSMWSMDSRVLECVIDGKGKLVGSERKGWEMDTSLNAIKQY